MKTSHGVAFEPAMESAITELQSLIAQQYPTAQFEVTTAPDDSTAVHLLATVDIDDTDDVVDIVIDRMTQLRSEEKVPILVIPLRTPERVARLLEEIRATRRSTVPTVLA